MSIRVTVDKAGRIVLPKFLRDELRLEPGDTLELESQGEELMLRPIRSTSPLKKERGVWVFRSGSKVSAADTDKALREVRRQRDHRTRGENW